MRSTRDVTAVIPCHNEASQLREAVSSARLLAEDIIIVDDFSTDKTVEVAKSLRCRVVTPPKNFHLEPGQHRIEWLRRFGHRFVLTEFVLRLDADERVTPDLARFSLREIQNDRVNGVLARRRNLFLDGWLDHGGWARVNQLFLVRLRAVQPEWDLKIHGQIPVSGQIVSAKKREDGYLLHLNYQSVDQFVTRSLIGYAAKDPRPVDVPRTPAASLLLGMKIWAVFTRKFLGRLVVRQGARDLSHGICAASLLAMYELMRIVYSVEDGLNSSAPLQKPTD